MQRPLAPVSASLSSWTCWNPWYEPQTSTSLNTLRDEIILGARTRLLPVYLLRIVWRKYDGTCVLTGDNCRSLPPIAISRLIIKWNEARPRPPSLALTRTSVSCINRLLSLFIRYFSPLAPPLSFAPSDCPHRYCRVSGFFPAVRPSAQRRIHPSIPHVTRS